MAAELVRPGGRLICTDFSEGMLGQARARAQELGLDNVEFRELDAESLDLQTASVDAVLGPEMKSTGEAMGIALDLPSALYKAFRSTMPELPQDGAALCSIADADKQEARPIIRALHRLGMRLSATRGTAQLLHDAGLPAITVQKLRTGHPNVVDVIGSGAVHLVINTVTGPNRADPVVGGVPLRDGYEIRRASVERRIPCLTSLDTARALTQALGASKAEPRQRVAPITDYVRAQVPEPVNA